MVTCLAVSVELLLVVNVRGCDLTLTMAHVNTLNVFMVMALIVSFKLFSINEKMCGRL